MKELKCRKCPPGLAQIDGCLIKHYNMTKEEFLERQNDSYSFDLGGDCVPETNHILHLELNVARKKARKREHRKRNLS